MHAVQVARWLAPWLIGIVAFGVILAAGYGLIGVLLLILVIGLAGGAIMSYIGWD